MSKFDEAIKKSQEATAELGRMIDRMKQPEIDVNDHEANYVWILAIPKATMHDMTEKELVEEFEAMKLAALDMLDFSRKLQQAKEREAQDGNSNNADCGSTATVHGT